MPVSSEFTHYTGDKGNELTLYDAKTCQTCSVLGWKKKLEILNEDIIKDASLSNLKNADRELSP